MLCGVVACCSYRTSEGIQVPFKVIPVVKELGRTRLEANVSVRSLFGAKMFALNTVVLVPVPDYTAKCNIMVTSGKAKYDATKKAIVSGLRGGSCCKTGCCMAACFWVMLLSVSM
jgi:AP-2 complex subunit mu-1